MTLHSVSSSEKILIVLQVYFFICNKNNESTYLIGLV